MKNSVIFTFGILMGLVIASLALTSFIFFWQTNYSQPANNALSTIVAGDLEGLSARVSKLELDQSNKLQEISWKLDQKLFYFAGLALTISAISAFFGIKTYTDIANIVKGKIDTEVVKAFAALDPSVIPIRIVGDAKLETVRKRLEMSGFKNIKTYNYLSKASLTGITILPIDNPEDENSFTDFVNAHRSDLNPSRSAFILFSTNHRISPETLAIYDNIGVANMPITAANAVFVVGRGLNNQ
jgi:hypothetical protein